jgi:hypothetical protein
MPDATAQWNAMNTAREEYHSLTVRIAACHRYTVSASKRFEETDCLFHGRKIRLCDCPILSISDLKGGGNHIARGDDLDIWISEVECDLEIIGSFDSLANLHLSFGPVTFTELWTSCAAADGAARNLSIHFKTDGSGFFRITHVEFVEYMPTPVDHNPKGHLPGHIPGRAHPVVAELRDMKHRLIGSWRGFLTFIGFAVGLFIIIKILLGVWHIMRR